MISRKPHRGFNTVLLWLIGRDRGYAFCEWATFNQWRERRCQVRKGEKAATVMF